jgi:hypothetical protein
LPSAPTLTLKGNASVLIYSIYKITHKENGKIYIGVTHDLYKRFRYHKKYKFDRNVFNYEVLYQSKDKNHIFNDMEPRFIKEYNSLVPNGFNQQKGGRQSRNDKPLELTKSDLNKLSSIFCVDIID